MIRTIPIDLLDPSPLQPRQNFDPTELAELTDSIRQQGILQPLLTRDHPTERGRLQIIAGERRWRAAQSAGLHTVPVLVRDFSDAEAMAAALVENLQRADLNAIEEGEGYQRLVAEFSYTQEALAQLIGKSRSHIANTLRLLHLPDSVKMDVRAGRLSAGHARALLGHPDPSRMALQVSARGLNVRQTEALARSRLDPAAGSEAGRQRDPDTLALERELTEHLGLPVKITHAGRGGSLRVGYLNLDQLDGLIALLKRP